MLKNFKKTSPLISAALIIFVIFVFPQTAQAAGWDFFGIGSFTKDAVMMLLAGLAGMLLKLMSWLTFFSGILLNNVIKYSVVDMAKFVSPPNGNSTINQAWGTIRDVANMGFIFILLYAGIKMILGVGKDAQKLIVNIIVVALLINFSLFFTKVVIDASNVLAVFFYGAMAPDAVGEGYSLLNPGLSDSIMKPLKLQTVWVLPPESSGITYDKLIIIGIMGSIVSLIAAFVFFAISIMFIIRFVVLVFVMILSPLAFMGHILPNLRKYWDQWLDTLIGQSFFAPIYFMLTWIVLRIVEGISLNTGGTWSQAFEGQTIVAHSGEGFTSVGGFELVITFIVVIVMLIASLVISKQYADKAGGLVGEATNWATRSAGASVLGGAGWAGRKTLGSASYHLKDNEKFKQAASEGGAKGMGARLALAAFNKGSKASFDARNTDAAQQISKRTGIDLGKLKVKKGEEGYAGMVKRKEAKYKEIYGRFKPSDDFKKAAEEEAKKKKGELKDSAFDAMAEFNANTPKSAEHLQAERDLAALKSDSLSALRPEHESELKAAEERVAIENKNREKLQQEFILSKTEEESAAAMEASTNESAVKNRMSNLAKRIDRGGFITPVGSIESSRVIRYVLDGKLKAKTIRGLSKEEDDEKKLEKLAAKVAAEKAKKKAEEDGEGEEKKDGEKKEDK